MSTKKSALPILNPGDVFGRLTLVSPTFRKNSRGHRMKFWDCVCACGSLACIRANSLVSGETKSCGCILREQGGAFDHGESGENRSIEYTTWKSIRMRVFSKRHKYFRYYGGRGITMCAGWGEFRNFLEDMGRRPDESHSIDRINNDGNYSCGHCVECIENGWPANCRWATHKEQSRNKRITIYLEVDGDRKSMSDWCELVGIDRGTVYARVRAGWGHKESLFTPIRRGIRREITETIIEEVKP